MFGARGVSSGSRRYTLFSGRVLDRSSEPDGQSPHFQILLGAGHERFRVAINTRSGSSQGRTSELLFFADDDFRHPVTRELSTVPDGSLPVESRPHGLALDYQRGGLVERRYMRKIPPSVPGPRNDLVDELDYRVGRALADPTIRLHAYGTRWGPEPEIPDQDFGFVPGNGIHDVHMNQGNRDEHWHDNAIWSDGGLIFHEPDRDRWCAIFLAFQSQSWHTDDAGNPIPRPASPNGHASDSGDDHFAARIIAAFVHPNDEKRGVEHVTIRNDSGRALDVTGWRVLNRAGEAMDLAGQIPPRRGRRFPLPAGLPLSTRGGRIRLLDRAGQEIDGVSYTRREARQKRGRLTF